MSLLTCLSVLDCGKVKHYKLKKLENGHYFVSRTKSFLTLKELVEHYSRQADGLCVRLTEPCKKVNHTVATTTWTKHVLFIFTFPYSIKSHCHVSKQWLPVCVDGGSTDSRSVLQHGGPMGDWPQLHQAAEEAGSRTVWWSVRGPVERNHSSCGEDPETWYTNASFSLTEGVEQETNNLGMSKNE